MPSARVIALVSLTAFLAATPLAEARDPRPYVKSVSPLRASVGEEMTVKGFYFTPGYRENVVVLVAGDGRVSYVRSEHSTKRSLKVIVPKKVERLLRLVNGVRVPTKFRIKVISSRMSRLSRNPLANPTIGPDVGGDCDNDGTPNPVDTDDDGDLLPDTIENVARTNPCVADSDGDKLGDGWEYMSALDLNHNAVPYPGKRPFPNPLFADAEVDYDGDGMHAWAEHAMWWAGGHKYPLDYSDGDQHSIHELAGTNLWDMTYPIGTLSDEERDFDRDGIANIIEYSLVALKPWTHYPGIVRPDFMDPDTDGDGLLDGADDQDHDGISNSDELDGGTWAMNPCDPLGLDGRSCPRWMEIAIVPQKPDTLCKSVTLLTRDIRWYKYDRPEQLTPEDLLGFCDGPIAMGERDY